MRLEASGLRYVSAGARRRWCESRRPWRALSPSARPGAGARAEAGARHGCARGRAARVPRRDRLQARLDRASRFLSTSTSSRSSRKQPPRAPAPRTPGGPAARPWQTGGDRLGRPYDHAQPGAELARRILAGFAIRSGLQPGRGRHRCASTRSRAGRRARCPESRPAVSWHAWIRARLRAPGAQGADLRSKIVPAREPRRSPDSRGWWSHERGSPTSCTDLAVDGTDLIALGFHEGPELGRVLGLPARRSCRGPDPERPRGTARARARGASVTARRSAPRATAIRAAAGPSVTVVAATKYVSLDDMATLAEAGVDVVGENRAQDLERKHAAYGDSFRWHFIGQLQSNKVKIVNARCELVHSLASDSAAAPSDGAGAARGQPLRRGEQGRVSLAEEIGGLRSHRYPRFAA